MAEETKKAPTRKKLADLFNEPCAIEMDRAFMHQAFALPGAGVENTISKSRPNTKELKIVYHPGYGLIGHLRGDYFLAPAANVIVAHEQPIKARQR